MAGARCTCGFTEGGDERLGDHLVEAFAPDDGMGPDGLVHLEGEVSLLCMCGAGGSAADLDAHFLAVFTPADHVGRDGEKHESRPSSPSQQGPPSPPGPAGLDRKR
jgi:hypothetical protein